MQKIYTIHEINKDLDSPLKNQKGIILLKENDGRILFYSTTDKEVKYLNQDSILRLDEIETIEDEFRVNKINAFVQSLIKVSKLRNNAKSIESQINEEMKKINIAKESILEKKLIVNTIFDLSGIQFSLEMLNAIKELSDLEIISVEDEKITILFAPLRLIPKNSEELILALKQYGKYEANKMNTFADFINFSKRYTIVKNLKIHKLELKTLFGAEELNKKSNETSKEISIKEIIENVFDSIFTGL